MTTRKNFGATVSRRGFLVGTAAGAGLVMGYGLLPKIGGIGEAMAAGTFSPNIWFTMDADGNVKVHVTKAEMGQHVGTPLAQALMEELEAPWEKVSIDYVSTDPKWGLMLTGGSWSINWTFDQMSRAGAAGRISLMEAAVKKWGVALADLRAEDGMIHHEKSGRQVSYGELVAGGIAPRNFSEEEMKALVLKDPANRKLVGKSVPMLDIPAKTNGSARFGIDVFVDGMVYGLPAVPPVRYGATVTAVDDSAAKKVPGYEGHVVIEDGTKTTTGWVVALAKSYPTALRAAQALNISYDLGPNAEASSEAVMALAQTLQANRKDALLFVKEGESEKTLPLAPVKHEAAYSTQFNIHAPLEPMNAVVEEKDGVWHIHTGNQFQFLAMNLVPAALGVDASQVVIHQNHLGGGFGRRLDCDYLIVAALAAKGAGKPVKLIYSREADTRMDFTRSLTYQKLSAGGEDGRITAMEHDVVTGWATARQAPGFLTDSVDKKGKVDGFSANGADHWYSIPHQTVRLTQNPLAQSAMPPGHLRSVAPGWTFWAVESFIDEMARKLGVDPLQFRLSMLDGKGRNAGTAPMSVGGAKRLAHVLQMAAEKAGYGAALPQNSAIGLAAVSAQERNTPTWTAGACEVAVSPDSGAFQVKKLTVVADVGTAVHPDGVKAQLEGGALWGLSLATKELATLKDGGIEQDNFDSYTPLRMEDVPELDVTVLSTGHYPVGCGEPATTVVAPALANAIHAAVGARVRALPITPEAVRAALKEA